MAGWPYGGFVAYGLPQEASAEVGFPQRCPAQIGTFEICAVQLPENQGTSQVSIAEVGSLELTTQNDTLTE